MRRRDGVLESDFTRSELDIARACPARDYAATQELLRTLECIQWLADSNYELQFSPSAP